jgi:hypothetical protein
MLASEVAWAADVSFSGQFRPRFNVDNNSTDANSNANTFFDTRVRLNAKANVNANTEVFLQFQSVGTWGKCNRDSGDSDMGAGNTGGCVGTRESTGGATGAGDAAEASDTLADVGLHQAYLTLKNLAGQAVDLKIGRQEVVIDGHRLFGHTGWTQGGETKDAIRLSHSAGNHSMGYTYIAADNSDNMKNSDSGHGNENVHVITASTQGIMGGALSGIFTYTNDNNASTSNWEDSNDWFTIGARQKGKMGGLDYRVEFYHQFGDAGSVANGSGLGITGASANAGSGIDRDAQMFGIRLGKTFKNAGMSPTITLWYDNLSGTSDDDATGGDFGTFDVLYDTGHKFYGFMDFYLNRAGANSGYFGMQDIALKTKMSPKAGWTFKADYHHFRTVVDIAGNDGDAVATTKLGGKMDPDLGTELDLTLVHKYDSNTKIAVGYSHYWTTTTFSQANAGGGANGATAGSNANDDADWAYVQIDTKF